ncbi:MAG TPA: hypothetical protein VFI25_18125 [Planctomycetota bacterium]|nr:hypothetical protein [Planctomycetota bacterium]
MRLARTSGVLLAAALAGAGCRSLAVHPTSTTAGSFRAQARAFHFVGWVLPRPALASAFEEASDRGLPNARVTSSTSYPDLYFPFSFLNRLLGFEGATVEGVYGNPP